MLTLTSVASAQSKIVYTYDANGNRIKRNAAAAKSQTRSKMDATTKITEGELTINIPIGTDLSSCTVSLYDISGNMIFSRTPSSYTEVIDTRSLHVGIYIITIDVNGERESHKFVKH